LCCFDEIINNIDIKCETLLAQNQALGQEKIRDIINNVRDKLIKTIDLVKNECLELLSKDKIFSSPNFYIENKNLFQKFCFILDSESIELLNAASLQSQLFLGTIIVTDEFVTPEEIETFKIIMRVSFGNDELIGSIFQFEPDDVVDSGEEDVSFTLSVK
jgi:hypothetical protein